MKLYKVTQLAYVQDISKTVFKTTDRYWKTSGQPIIYASSTKLMAAQEYFHSISQVNAPDDLVTCCYEVPRNVVVTYLDKAILPDSADNNTYFFMIKAVIENWRENGDTLIIKLPMTFLPGKDILVNPMHSDYQQLTLISTESFDAAHKPAPKVPQLEKPNKNARRRYKRAKPDLDVLFCHAPKQKQQIVNALRKEINKYGLRYLVDTELVLYNEGIAKGLMRRLNEAKYIIIVITEDLIDKPNTGNELEKILQQQLTTGEKRILLVIHAGRLMLETLLIQVPLLKTYHYYKWENNANEIIWDIMARMANYLSK